MTTVTPDDIPASVTDLLWTAPFVSISPTERINLTEPDARAVLAHFWPAIREHFARCVQEQNPDRGADFSDGVDWATDTIRSN